jgi:transcriptional regulator with XRE-family HTH domain
VLPFCHVTLRGRKPLPAAYPRELLTLGDHVRKRRLDLGLLQREVAERLGVDKTTVFNWERGRTTPLQAVRPALFEFLGYVPYTLVNSPPIFTPSRTITFTPLKRPLVEGQCLVLPFPSL